MEDKTFCPNCETTYNKNRWLFNFCPNCKGKNLEEIKGENK